MNSTWVPCQPPFVRVSWRDSGLHPGTSPTTRRSHSLIRPDASSSRVALGHRLSLVCFAVATGRVGTENCWKSPGVARVWPLGKAERRAGSSIVAQPCCACSKASADGTLRKLTLSAPNIGHEGRVEGEQRSVSTVRCSRAEFAGGSSGKCIEAVPQYGRLPSLTKPLNPTGRQAIRITRALSRDHSGGMSCCGSGSIDGR